MQTVFIYRTLIKESISRFPKTIETVRRDSAGLPWSSLCLYIQPKQLLSLKQNDCGNYFLYAPCQWETTLHYNIVSHWLGAYTKWSLWLYIPYIIVISFVLVVLSLAVVTFIKVYWLNMIHLPPYFSGLLLWIRGRNIIAPLSVK